MRFQYNIRGYARALNDYTSRYSSLHIFIDRQGFERTEIWDSSAVNVANGMQENFWYGGKALVAKVNGKFNIVFKGNSYHGEIFFPCYLKIITPSN